MDLNVDPPYVFPVRELIIQEMIARKWSKSHLANLLGWNIGKVNALLFGRQKITKTVYMELQLVFGESVTKDWYESA